MTEVEDEDSWLYGDSVKEKTEPGIPGMTSSTNDEITIKNEQNAPEESMEQGEPLPIFVNGKDTGPPETNNTVEPVVKAEAKNDEDDEESDDDVQVTIGEITTGSTPSAFPQTGLRTFYRNPVPVAPKPTITKGLDMEAPGDINGTPVMETNIDLLDEKPWRKPGADISDYFNYSFNEDSWKQYCDKQKKFRGQLENAPVINLPLFKSIQNGVNMFNAPPYLPIAKFENTVRSISTLQFSRRKEGELGLLNAAVASAASTTINHTSAPIAPINAVAQSSASQVFMPHMRQPMSGTLPNTPLPFPPINPAQPPPGMPIGVPPPGFLISGVPPPGIPPPGVVPPPGYLQSATLAYPPDFQPPIAHPVPLSYYNQKDGGGGGEQYNQYADDRHRRPSDSEADRHSEEDGRYRRERDSSSRRDYDRDRYTRRDYRERESRPRERDRDRDREKERDRDRDKEREKDRDREKDRERDKERERGHEKESSSSRRYRDESPSRHKSSRRKHEDDERHPNKHKKAKKHKHKDRDSDAPPGTDDAAACSDDPNK